MDVFFFALHVRVSQKFVPLISCAITFDQNFYHFYLKFQRDVYCSIEYMYSECQLPVFPLWLFVYHILLRRYGMEWDKSCSLKSPRWSIAFFVFTWCAVATSTLTISFFFRLGNWKKYFEHLSKKSLSAVRLLYFFTNSTQAQRCLADWLRTSTKSSTKARFYKICVILPYSDRRGTFWSPPPSLKV